MSENKTDPTSFATDLTDFKDLVNGNEAAAVSETSSFPVHGAATDTPSVAKDWTDFADLVDLIDDAAMDLSSLAVVDLTDTAADWTDFATDPASFTKDLIVGEDSVDLADANDWLSCWTVIFLELFDAFDRMENVDLNDLLVFWDPTDLSSLLLCLEEPKDLVDLWDRFELAMATVGERDASSVAECVLWIATIFLSYCSLGKRNTTTVAATVMSNGEEKTRLVCRRNVNQASLMLGRDAWTRVTP